MGYSPPVESFPTTQPAFVMKGSLVGQFPCGDIHTGSTLVAVPFSAGSVQSIDGFEPKMDLKMIAGHDWFRIDADKQHGRLTISAVVSDAENRCVRISADGIIDLNEETMPMLMGDPTFKMNRFGHAVEQIRLECGHEPYNAIDSMTFVGSLRFIKEGEQLVAEIRAARVIPGKGTD